MLKYAYILILILTYSPLIAQNQAKTFKGRIIDSATLLPIPFAHIRTKESVFISSQDGGYSITYLEIDINSVIKISCIGYKELLITIADLRKVLIVKLVPDVVVLNEVVVSELSPQNIFRKSEKRGFKNYQTPRFSVDYTLEKLVFYEDTDSILAAYREFGIMLNRGLDTTDVYPNFVSQSIQTSNHFLRYDTVPNQLTLLTKQRNTISKEILLTYDPVRVGLLKQFHPIPAMFSDGFYGNTEQRILSIVNLDGVEHYLIGVYPKTTETEVKKTKDELKQIVLYKQKLKDLAIQSGRFLSDSTLDSIFSTRGKSNQPSYTILGFFLVNTKNYGISHCLIKVNTFDSFGNLYAKLHVAASYIEIDKSYYLQNLDVLLKRTPPSNSTLDKPLYYLLTLKLSNFELKSKSTLLSKKSKANTELSDLLINNYSLDGFESFLIPAKDCTSCPNNPLRYFNQIF